LKRTPDGGAAVPKVIAE